MSQGRQDGLSKTTTTTTTTKANCEASLPVVTGVYTWSAASVLLLQQRQHICHRWLIIIRRSISSLFASFTSLLLNATGVHRLLAASNRLAITSDHDDDDDDESESRSTNKVSSETNMNQSEANQKLSDKNNNSNHHMMIDKVEQKQSDTIYTATTISQTTGNSSALANNEQHCDMKTITTPTLETATSSSSSSVAAEAVETTKELQQVAQLSDQLLWEALDKSSQQSNHTLSQVVEQQQQQQQQQLWSTETTMSDTQSLEPPALTTTTTTTTITTPSNTSLAEQSATATTADQQEEADIKRQQATGGSSSSSAQDEQEETHELAVAEETVAPIEDNDKDCSLDRQTDQRQDDYDDKENNELPRPETACCVAEDNMPIGDTQTNLKPTTSNDKCSVVATPEDPIVNEQQVESQVSEKQQEVKVDNKEEEETSTAQPDSSHEDDDAAQERQSDIVGVVNDNANQTDIEQQQNEQQLQQQQQNELDAASLSDSCRQVESDLVDSEEQQQQQPSPLNNDGSDSPAQRDWSGNSSVEPIELLEEDEDDLEEDFCGESASNSTLRRLKMDTFEDVLVCGQNRDSLEAARRLFDNLVRQQQQQQLVEQRAVPSGGGRSSAPPPVRRSAGSLHSSEDLCDSSEEAASSSSSAGIGGGCSSSSAGERCYSSSAANDEDSLYDIKIVRRTGSSVSNSNSFRQTLVCSLSPTSQLNVDGCSPGGGISGGMNGLDLTSNSPDAQYPIDGDEIKQCREAFRENKRLIEEQQERATKHLISQLARCQSSTSCRADSTTCSSNSNNNNNSSNKWNKFNRDYLEQQAQSKCSHCNLRLYPIDRMELDFTRATLNIHRNCFKCQVCSTLLRLETYAALDAKLYCPAHIKCVTPSR